MHWELNRGEYSQLARNQTKYHGKENIWLDLKDQEAFHTEVLGVEGVKNVKEEMDKDKKEPSGGLSTELGGKTKVEISYAHALKVSMFPILDILSFFLWEILHFMFFSKVLPTENSNNS